MFGSKKDAERLEAQEFRQRVFDSVRGDIKIYCSKVIPFAASGPLRELARNIEEMQGDPLNEQVNKRKAEEVTLFTNNAAAYLDPLKAQLKAQIETRYGSMLDAGTKELVGELVNREFREQRGYIVQAAGYIAGLSGPWIKELLGGDESGL